MSPRSRWSATLATVAAWATATTASAAPPRGAEGVGPPVEETAPDPAAGSGLDSPSASAPTSRSIRIQAIEVLGREQVARTQLDRILSGEGIRPGVVVLARDERIERVRARLRATGYFRLVSLRIRPIPGDPGAAVLVVELEERSSVAVTDLYLGTSRLTPFHGGLQAVERNLLGRGIHLGGGFVWSSLATIPKARRQQAFRVFAEVPRIGRARLGALGGAYIVSAGEPYRVAGAENDPDPRLFRTFDLTRIGGVLGLTFPLLPGLSTGVDYRFERVEVARPVAPVWVEAEGQVHDLDLHVRDGAHRLTAAHFSLSWDGRQETGIMGKGGRFALDLQLSSPALGSSYEYMKLVAGGAYTFRLPWRHWLTPSATGGQIAGGAPRYELFYSGDVSAWTPGRVQGLRTSTRNPVDVFGTGMARREFGVIFGRVDLEYVWPLFRRTRTQAIIGGDLFLSVGVFTLVGDAAERAFRAQRDELRVPLGFNADFGLRLDTAIGTIHLSVGNVLRRVPL
jgi:outer membrane protein assembly factor BamA